MTSLEFHPHRPATIHRPRICVLTLLLKFTLISMSPAEQPGGAIYEELFSNPMSDANETLGALGWEAYANASATRISESKGNELRSGAFVASAPGNPSNPPGFLACGLMNELGINEYAILSPEVSLAEPSKIQWRMHGTPGSGVKVQVLVRVDDRWFVSKEVFRPVATGGPGEFQTADADTCLSSLDFKRNSADWSEFALDPKQSMEVGASLTADLPSGPLTGLGFYVTTENQTPSMLRLDTVQVLP